MFGQCSCSAQRLSRRRTPGQEISAEDILRELEADIAPPSDNMSDPLGTGLTAEGDTSLDSVLGPDEAVQPEGPTLQEVWSEAKQTSAQGNHYQAIEQYENIIKSIQFQISRGEAPQGGQQVIAAAVYQQAMAYLELKDNEQALKLLNELISTGVLPIQINILEFQLFRHQVLLEVGKIELDLEPPRAQEAMEHFRTGLSSRPTDAELHLQLGIATTRQARRIQNRTDSLATYESAARSLDRAVKIREDYAEAYFERGKTKAELAGITGEWDEAIEDLIKASELDPNNIEYQVEAGFTYLQRGKQTAARRNKEKLGDVVRDHREAIAYISRFIEKHKYLPKSLGGPGKPDDAEEPEKDETILENAIVGRADARLSLAKFLPEDESKVLYQEAIKDSELALEIEPDYGLAYYNRALARRLLGNLEGAVEDLSKVMQTAPRLSGPAILRRGIIYYRQNRFDLALADLDAASALKDGRALFWTGVIQAQRGDDPAALASYSAAIRQNPGYSYAYYNRAIVYLRTGMYERALEDLNELLRRDRENGDVYRLRATTYRALNRHEDAAQSLQAAARYGA